MVAVALVIAASVVSRTILPAPLWIVAHFAALALAMATGFAWFKHGGEA